MADFYSTCTYSRSSNSNHPSFSSTLLDSIYRSIDQSQEEILIYSEKSMRINKNYASDANVRVGFRSDEEMANFKRACMIEKWMEKKVSQNDVVARRKSAADSPMKKSRKDRDNSSSSSSDSSYGGGLGFFSDSFPVQRLKPVRTGSENEKHHKNPDQLEQKSKHEGGFLKTKSRALKIYGDLKKVKQPISPGGKVAAFLNSIFTAANLKKPKIASNDDVSPSLKTSTTCSSASSFSRSCLSKTPSTRSKSSNGPKRSVRFSPVSVIIDEDIYQKSNNNLNKTSNFHNNQNNDHRNTSIRSVIDQELMVHVLDKNRRVEEAARDLIRNYQKKIQSENDKSHVQNQVFDRDYEEDDDEDDAVSCGSSDLFELDNLSAIGMDEELPVYETTHLHTNRAIANGFIL